MKVFRIFGPLAFLFLPLLIKAQISEELPVELFNLKKYSEDKEYTHYTQFSTLSTKAGKGNKTMDTIMYKVSWDISNIAIKEPFYLPFQPDSFGMQPPPANSSEMTQAELNYLLKLQSLRTQEERDMVVRIDNNQYGTLKVYEDTLEQRKPLFYIGSSLGDWYNPYNLPNLSLLLAKLQADINLYVNTYKLRYKRARPWQLEKQILTFTKYSHASSSYPSGHAAFAFATALVMSEIAPDYADVFMREAKAFAWSREQGGVHYPSDTEASRNFCIAYFNKIMLQSPEFRSDIEKAKMEWQQKQPK
jgi:acid phosphatase (class A)